MNAARPASPPSPHQAAAWLLCCAAAALPARAAEHQVIIDNMRFTPQIVQARPGDTITWVNRDLVAHNVTAAAANVKSGDLAPGQSWRYTVRAGSSFDYACNLHPVMTGRVELEAGSSTRTRAASKTK